MKIFRSFLMLLLPVVLVLSSCTKDELLSTSETDKAEFRTTQTTAAAVPGPTLVLPDLVIRTVRSTLTGAGPCPIPVGGTPLPDGTGNVTFTVGIVVKNNSPVAIPAGTQVQAQFRFSGLPTIYSIPDTQGFAANETRIYRRQVSLPAATGSPIGIKTRTVTAVIDRPNNVAEHNENNNTDNDYKFCDDV